MKKILFTIIMICCISGCSSQVDTAVVAGAAAGGVVKGVSDYYEQQAQLALTRIDIAKERLTNAATEAEKQAATVELANAQSDADLAKTKAEGAKIIATTDWTTTGGSVAGAALLSNLLTQLWIKRKQS